MDTDKHIIFRLKEQTFAVHVQQIVSIERALSLTQVPRTPDFLKGVTEMRGVMTPIIDLRERLELGGVEITDQTRTLVVQVEDMQIGMAVDQATEVKDIPASLIKPAPKLVGEINDTFLLGVATIDDELILLLDLEQIIQFTEKNQLKEIINDIDESGKSMES
ncbi:chemotaxis protein CheW [Oceanobacillus jeddahense]|uniref:Chemotaxis protein CheW n=1 Tax=Oceanobacillus jeddahense TaxID=1462527 RepID=A0ABY5JUC9_9BACI|nr:chemotaxis protein CheW [Oceanobacillus jeddahense]UUI02169.1 chemotaxis protein CheW [Oceanobacillus jeddahense]